MHLQMYLDVLPMFKSCILTLEQKVPLIHRLHDEQVSLIKSFLACFIKHEVLKDLSASKLKHLDVEDKKNQLPKSEIYLGQKATMALQECNKIHQVTTQEIGVAMVGMPFTSPVEEQSVGQESSRHYRRHT
jgi:hypothetical protein